MSWFYNLNFRGLIFVFALLFASPIFLYCQGIGISDVNIVAHPSSILELRSTTQGVLVPRVTTAERDAIVSPADGLLVFNTSTSRFNFYAAGWEVIGETTTTNANLTGEVTSVGNAATLGSFTSASLRTALTDETGTAKSVYSDSPTLSGMPLAPTATVGTNTTQLATTAFVLANTGGYSAVAAGADITTTSTTDTQVTGMTLTPGAGTYVVNFNGQCTIPDVVYTTGINTTDLKADLNLIYNDITNFAVTNTSHPLNFGSETIGPGVYSLAGAITLSGALTLDGQGDANSLFVIRSSAAFDAGAAVTVSLINGASSENIFWVAEGAMGIGATTTIPGTLFSNAGAIAVGTDCTISGRLLTKSGAVSFGAGLLSVPTAISPHIDLRTLTDFVIFTGAGGIANSGVSTYTGDIGTNLGAITGFTTATVNGTIYEAGSTAVVTPINHEATFSLYQDGVLIANSSRTLLISSVISLHGITTLTNGQTIDVRWKMDTQNSDDGSISIDNRVLSLTKVQ
jgi:hypothetical protein